MDNKNVSTKLGAAILVVIAITIGVFVWVYEKQQNWDFMITQPGPVPKQVTKNSKSAKDTTANIVIAEPVEQWKTCRNEKLGYEIKYPKSWNIYDKNGNFGVSSGCSDIKYSVVISPENKNSIDITPLKSYLEISYEQVSKGPEGFHYQTAKSLDEYLSYVGHNSIVKETVIDGEKAVFLDESPHPAIALYHNGKIFFLNGSNISDQSFEYFLSTFQFLK